MDEERREDVPTALINQMCAKWGEVQSFVEMYHPDKAVASRVINLFNDNAMSHVRTIVKHKQKQISLDKFLVKKAPSEFQAESASKKQNIQEIREKTPEVQLPDVIMEGGLPFQPITSLPFHLLSILHLRHQVSWAQVRVNEIIFLI